MIEQHIERIKTGLGHEGFRRYFKNTTWLFAGRIANMAVSFFAAIYVVRSLGPDKYGVLSYAVSFAGLSTIIANLGIDSIVSRELARNPERKNVIIGSAVVLKLCGAILALAVTGIVTYAVGNGFYISMLILLITGSYLFSSLGIINLYFQARAASSYPTIVSFVAVLILSLMKVGGILYSLPLFFFAFIYFFEPVLYAFGYLLIYRIYEKVSTIPWQVSFAEIKRILKDSWPLLISGAFVVIYSRIDQVMIRSMIGTTSVGLYDAGARLSEAWYFVPALITTAVFPALINAKKVDDGLYDKRLGRLYFALTWIGVAITVAVYLFAPWGVHLLYGSAYAETATVVRMYVLATVGVFITTALYQHLINENRTVVIFTSSVVGALSNIALNLFLIPQYGIYGAAFATFISYSLIPISIILFKSTRSHAWFILKSIFSI